MSVDPIFHISEFLKLMKALVESKKRLVFDSKKYEEALLKAKVAKGLKKITKVKDISKCFIELYKTYKENIHNDDFEFLYDSKVILTSKEHELGVMLGEIRSAYKEDDNIPTYIVVLLLNILKLVVIDQDDKKKLKELSDSYNDTIEDETVQAQPNEEEKSTVQIQTNTTSQQMPDFSGLLNGAAKMIGLLQDPEFQKKPDMGKVLGCLPAQVGNMLQEINKNTQPEEKKQ